MVQKQALFTLMGGKVKFRRGLYNPTSDAVWLAAFAKTGDRTVLDVGIGTGGVALCLMAHHPDITITGLDIAEPMLAECAENAKLNNRTIELINTDILTWRTGRTFDLVVSNPPYFKGTPAKHGAHHNIDLVDWTEKCVRRVKPRGTFCTIIDASAMGDVIAAMTKNCGDITLFPLFGAKKTAERVLISGRVGTRGPGRLYSGLSMNYDPILRDGLTIDAALVKLCANV